MKNVKIIAVGLSLMLFSLLIGGGFAGEVRSKETSQDVPLKSLLSVLQPSVQSAESPNSNGDPDSIIHLLVNDDELERKQRQLGEIWLSYLISFEENNKSAERLGLEASQKDLMLAKDSGKEIEGEILRLPPILPADYTGHYLGREKFTVVLSSFENLEFYESLFPDLSLVEFKLVDYSYLELYAVAEALNEHIPDALARVNSVLGRITISLYIDPDQEEAATSFIRTLDVYDKYKAFIDIQVTEPDQAFPEDLPLT